MMWSLIFEPQGELIVDIARFLLFFLISFLVIWLVELWLCRNFRITRSDTELNIHFAWLILFTIYGALVTGLAVVLLRLFKESERLYTIYYLGLGLFSFGLSWYFNRKIAQRCEEVEE